MDIGNVTVFCFHLLDRRLEELCNNCVEKLGKISHAGRGYPHAQHLWGGVISGVIVITGGKINIPAGFLAGGTFARLRMAIVQLRIGYEVE